MDKTHNLNAENREGHEKNQSTVAVIKMSEIFSSFGRRLYMTIRGTFFMHKRVRSISSDRIELNELLKK